MLGTGPCEPPYGDLFVGRSLLVNGRAVRATDGGDEAGIDLTGGRWSVRLRAFTDAAATSVLVNDAIAASSTAGASGYYDDVVLASTFGATPYSALWLEEVLVDASNADTGTISGKVEQVLRWWKQPLLDRPAS